MSAPWDPAPWPSIAPFWEGLAEGRLRAPWCERCDRPVLYPRALCPRCHDEVGPWRDLSGRGTVYACAVEHRAWLPGFDLEPPYVVAVVELEEGARLVTNVIAPPDDVVVGMPVVLHPVDVPGKGFIARFVPAG